MCVYIHVYIYIDMHVYIHTCIYSGVCVSVCTWTSSTAVSQTLPPHHCFVTGFLYTWCSEPQTTHTVLYPSQRKEQVTATY